MDLSQLLSSGFQFLNLDDACEAEVDILNDMLFKDQDVTQLSKLFHLKSYPDGDENENAYYAGLEDPIHVQSLLPAEHGEEGDEGIVVLPPDNPNLHLTDTHLEQQQQQQHQQHQQDAAVNEQLQQQLLRENTDASIPLANGPLMPMSPQHHVINVEGNPGEIAQSGEMSGQMMTSIPPPIRSYYSQQHVPVVHGSPQTQVGSPAMGQAHGQVGLVHAGYPNVSVPISMHQQQVIMMQQAQAVHSYVGIHHYVQPHGQRHHGHPQHSYVQGEPLSPESVQYHHNPNLIKVTHDPSTHSLPHTHQANPSPQGGPSKYSNGSRKNHSRNIDRNRRNDSDMMNNYPTYYPNIAFPGMAYYNQHQQLAHTVTGSPIIMSASHHSKVPVTMYNPYAPSHQQQYNSPPPSVQQGPITPQTSPPEAQQQQQQQPPEPGSTPMVGSHPQHQQQQQQHLPPPPSNSPPQPHPHQHPQHVGGGGQGQEENLNEEIQSENIQGQGQHPRHSDIPSHGQMVVPMEIPSSSLPQTPVTVYEPESVTNLTSPVPFSNSNPSTSKSKKIEGVAGEDVGGGGAKPSSPTPALPSHPPPHHHHHQPHQKQQQHQGGKKQQQVQVEEAPSNLNTGGERKRSIASPSAEEEENQLKQKDKVKDSSPQPDLVQQKQVLVNKCSSSSSSDASKDTQNRIPSQQQQQPPSNVNSCPNPPTPVSTPVQPKPQTWAETSAPKSYRATTSSGISNSSSGGSSSSIPGPASSLDEKQGLREKQGQINHSSKSASAEFPALAKQVNSVNTSGGSVSSSNNVASGSSSASASHPERSAAPSSATSNTPSTSTAAPRGRSWASICKRQEQGQGSSVSFSTGAPLSTSIANGGSVEGSSGSDKDGRGNACLDNNCGSYVPIQGQGHVGGENINKANKTCSNNAIVPNTGSAAGSVPQSSSTATATTSSSSSSHHGTSGDLQTGFDMSCLNNENDALAIRLGEFLANYMLDHHATALTPRGLINQSNFCYINATLQALMACPPFVNLFRSMREVGLGRTPCKATPIIQSVYDFVAEFEPLNRGGNSNKRDRRNDSFITGANLEPTGIRKVLGLFEGSTFKVEGRQQDAEEFLSHLLNGLHDEMIKVIKWYENSRFSSPQAAAPVLQQQPQQPQQQTLGVVNGGQQHTGESVGTEEDDDADHWQVMGPKNKGCLTRKTNVIKSPISEMLFGQLCSALHRTNSFKSVALQPFFTLQLDIQNDSIRSVRDALEGLSFKEEVSGLVSTSGQETEAYRQLTLEELPMILILHLKRFVYDKSGNKIQKLDKKLDFGIDLEVAKEHLSVNTRPKCTPKQRQYKLFAVVYHDGEEAYKGHYIADCFHPSGGFLWGQVGWLRYDDITVKPIAENLMLNSQPPRVPYLLYYRRADTLVSHVQNPRKDRPRNFGSSSGEP